MTRDGPQPRDHARIVPIRRDGEELLARAKPDDQAGRIEDAKRTIRLALRTGTRDREILRHAEVIG